MKLIFHTYQHKLQLVISSENPSDRDYIETPRYQLIQGVATGKTTLMASERWDDIQDKIEEVVKNADK